MTEPARRIGIVGAGVVGAACALRLSLDGYEVTMLDPEPPGSGCSHGNAGQIGTAGIVPFVNPRTAAKAWSWSRDPDHPLRVPLMGMARNLRWIRRFRRAATDARSAAATRALHSLARRVYRDLEPLLEAASAAPLIDRRGTLQVFEDRTIFESLTPDFRLREEYGNALTYFDRAELLELEPALGPTARHGVLFDDAALVRNPRALTEKMVAAVLARGGSLKPARVRGLKPVEQGVAAITEEGRLDFAQIVLAAGIHARTFFRRLGVTVPLWAERGYHLQLPDLDHGLTRSVLFYDRRVVFSPLETGLRLTTGAEFTAPDAPPAHDLYRRLFQGATGLLRESPDLERGVPWVGSRPSPPDFLPIIGRAPRLPNVILAAGHGHSGLTFAAPTARLVSGLVAGAELDGDIAAFAPDRPG